MTFQEQIDNIMDTFEFGRVHEMMKAVGWGWGEPNVVPDESELRKSARRHLNDMRSNCISSSGGFTAYKRDGVLNLHWGLDSLVTTDGVEPDDGGE